jgi:enamine deaminase RidA (YjgF/YER057c/UK114 family)
VERTLSKRRSIEVAGLPHTNPIPAASRIGPFVVTGSISGKDPQTGQVPPGIEEQCAQMFANVRRLIEAASGTPDDILKVTVWMKDRGDRKYLNPHWQAMFPDPASRPARHTFVSRDLVEPILVECEFMAVISGE